jgi:hypothetical protein
VTPLSELFAGLPTYQISQRQPTLWEKVKGFFSKQRRWESDLQTAFLLAHSGRTLRAMRPWHVNWEVLRRIAITQPLVFSIVSTAVRELSGMQWAVVVKKHRPAIQRKAAEIETFLSRPVPGVEGLTFAEWLKKILRDLFIYDAVAIEVIRDPQTGELLALKPVPAWQIEAQAVPETDDLDPEYPYIRTNRGQIIAKYKPGELIYFKENPRTDSPYGISPLEAAITIVSIIMWADIFQLKNFTVTEVPEGILDLGNVPHDVVERFRQWWMTEVIGRPEKVVIVGGSTSGVKWIPFRGDNRAMQFRQLYDWYARILCMCFGVRPQDVGLIEGLNRAVAQELAIGGKRVSLYPRALLLKEIIDHDILEELFDVDLNDMEFKWLDLERRDFEQSSRIIRTLGTMYMTVNEAREMLGLDRAVGGLADTLFWQAGAMAFVVAKVPKEGEVLEDWLGTEPEAPGMWQGVMPEMGGGEEGGAGGSPFGGLFVLPLGGEEEGGKETEGAEGATEETKEKQLRMWEKAVSQRFAPLRKVATLMQMATSKLVTEGERTAAWAKVLQKHLSLRIPVYKLEILKDGEPLSALEDYIDVMDALATAEEVEGFGWLWAKIWKGIADVDARTCVVNVGKNSVTFILKGKRLEKHLTVTLPDNP